MDNTIGKPGSSTNITSDQTFEPEITSHPGCPPAAQSSYSAKIITPADSLIVAAAESFPRGSDRMDSGSNFGARVSSLGSSISHMITDLTSTLAERAHETLDMISTTAHDLTDAVAHVDYQSVVDETRRDIRSHPRRDIAIAAGVGIALGLLASSRRSRH